jgi:hypothetical protein
MRTYETCVFGAPLEELRKKYGAAPNSMFFLELEFVELDVFGKTLVERS